MRYEETCFAEFVARPNRFIAHVRLEGCDDIEVVHVKNTGRCRELLVPGCRVVLARGKNPARKTAFDLVGVYKYDGIGAGLADGALFNIDSQAPNMVAGEWLASRGFDLVKPEFTYGQSRVDFYMERRGEDGQVQKCLMEVKGCTLEREGVGYFPDAPTERGVKHLRELAAAAAEGIDCTLCFVIQMEGVSEVRPNVETDPAFAQALADARAAGVSVLYLCCGVEPDRLWVREALWAE